MKNSIPVLNVLAISAAIPPPMLAGDLADMIAVLVGQRARLGHALVTREKLALEVAKTEAFRVSIRYPANQIEDLANRRELTRTDTAIAEIASGMNYFRNALTAALGKLPADEVLVLNTPETPTAKPAVVAATAPPATTPAAKPPAASLAALPIKPRIWIR